MVTCHTIPKSRELRKGRRIGSRDTHKYLAIDQFKASSIHGVLNFIFYPSLLYTNERKRDHKPSKMSDDILHIWIGSYIVFLSIDECLREGTIVLLNPFVLSTSLYIFYMGFSNNTSGGKQGVTCITPRSSITL